MSNRDNLTSLLSRIEHNFDGDSLTIQEMVAAIEDRGFGPLLLLPALLVVLPTGAIPGVPTAMAIVNTLIAGQLIFGRTHPWIPRKLGAIAITKQTFDHAYKRGLPITRRIDRLMFPRLERLTASPGPRLIAAACAGLGLLMIPLEIVPFAAAIPATAIAFMALGLCVRDGAVIVLGMGVAVSGFAAVFWLSA